MTATMSPGHAVIAPQDEVAAEVPVLMHWAWSPLGLFLVISVPAIIGSLLIPEATFREFWGQPPLISSDFSLAIIAALVAILSVFTIGLPLYARKRLLTVTYRQAAWLTACIRTLFAVTLTAYGIWFLTAVARGLSPDLLLGALNGEQGATSALKNRYLDTIPGVTTWMHLGVLLGPLLVLRWKVTKKSPVRLLLLLFVLAGFRALFFSERLALVEVAAGTVLALLIFNENPPRFLSTVPRVLATFSVAWVSLVVFFAAFEYNRSWLNFYAEDSPDGLIVFAWRRLLGYYATAVNNGVLYAEAGTPDYNFAALIPGVGWLPIISGGSRFSEYQALLARASNPEFNNVSGVTVPIAVLGPILGVLFLALLSLILVIIARGATSGSITGLVLYAVCAVGILELARIYYFDSSRFLVILVGVLALYLSAPKKQTAARAIAAQRRSGRS